MPTRIQVYSDPLQHALLAGTVVAPLGRDVVTTAVLPALVIDLDHVVAARSVRIRDTTGLAARPRSHSLLTALGAGALATALAGPRHGWAAFAGLASHLLHDAGDRAAPTPVLWPARPPRQLGRRVQLAGTLALLLGSLAISRATAGPSPGRTCAACGDGGGASARPRTA
jgi:membrane-bound metal-dependent hydrolase YbcI (DUF457 family)